MPQLFFVGWLNGIYQCESRLAMDNAVTVEISVKPEPIDAESAEDNHLNGYSQESDESK